MNPLFDVYKKCLIVGHLPTMRCQADPCYFVFQVDNCYEHDHNLSRGKLYRSILHRRIKCEG